MQVKIFSFTPSMYRLKIDANEVERCLNAWLAEHADKKIHQIVHDTLSSFWYSPQLIVTIYYEET